MSYTLKISIREQASSTGEDWEYARPERFWELGDRNIIEIDSTIIVLGILESGGAVLLHDGGIGDWAYVAQYRRIEGVDRRWRTRRNKR